MSKKIRGASYRTVRSGASRTQQGLPQDLKAQAAYWMAYIEFLVTMTEDPRFVWLYGDMEE
jgi:hypothetical protein